MTSTRPRPAPARRSAGRPTRAQTAELDAVIRDAALRTFLEHGYDGTSMDAIAKAAAATKAAVYGRYPSKAALFGAVLEWATDSEDWPVKQPRVPEAADLETALRAIARAAVRRDLHPDVIRLFRMVAAQAAKFPDLATRVSAQPAWPARQRVTALLEEHEQRGLIEVPGDPAVWAELFLGLVSGVPARLAAVGAKQTPKALDEHVEASLQIFLRSLRRC